MKKRSIGYIIAIAAVAALSVPLLGRADASAFLRWYAMAFWIGLGFFPLSTILFRNFADKGWIFSKVLGIAVSGFAVWALSAIGILSFTSRRSLVITLIAMGLVWSILIFRADKSWPADWNLVFREELIFLVVFLAWTYIAAFRPEARGTEKYMDYGFMAAMNRSTSFPVRDMWFGTDPINYYYGGQYYAVYLTKITWTSVKQTYNLMRALVAAFAATLSFSLVRQMLCDRLKEGKRRLLTASAGGAVAAVAVSFAGNFHYVLYKLFGKVFRLSGYEGYWFPDSTRYIGHNPLTNDQCIHEFPSYSYVLGDLHAHVVNLMFVLLVLGLLYSWAKLQREKGRGEAFSLRSAIAEPRLLFAGALAGLFRWTNYWDFVIYFTVILIIIVVLAIDRYRKDPSSLILTVLLQGTIAFLIGWIAALPFTASFRRIAGSVAVAQVHSRLYQFLVLWGLPLLVLVSFFIFVLAVGKKRRKEEGLGNGFTGLVRGGEIPDVIVLAFLCCAAGLILIPEVIYVKDIYEQGFSRTNTMFKLTYQAFAIFGLGFGYVLPLFVAKAKRVLARIPAIALACLFALTVPYGGYAISCWYGNVFDRAGYKGLAADAFLEEVYPEDAPAIRWLDENLTGQPVVLEAEGDSYSDYCRVSAMTGLPTVQGWYVHEWLWRGDPEELTRRAEDIQKIYTSENEEEVRALLRKYHVEFIFVGSMERECYENINHELLLRIGNIAFGEEDGTYILTLK